MINSILSFFLDKKYVRVILALLNSVIQVFILAVVSILAGFSGAELSFGTFNNNLFWGMLQVAPMMSLVIGWYMALSSKDHHHWFLKVLVFLPIIFFAYLAPKL